jgi:hypothetical protein
VGAVGESPIIHKSKRFLSVSIYSIQELLVFGTSFAIIPDASYLLDVGGGKIIRMRKMRTEMHNWYNGGKSFH